MTKGRRVVALLAIASLLLVPAQQGAAATATERRARDIVADVLATRAARGSVPGIAIMRDGDMLAGRNARDLFVPASLQKLPITAAALMRFGPEHRFTTRVVATGDDMLDGSVEHLALVGGGDPTLATNAFRKRYFVRRKGMARDERVFPSGSPTIEQLAKRIEAAGVTRVRGNLIADDFLFDDVRTQAGWKSSYLDRSTGGPYVGYLSALVVDQGYADLDQLRIAKSPARFTAKKLRDALAARGIRIDGRVINRRTPAGATHVALVRSPPLEEIVGWVNRWSANHPAELLLKGLGAAYGEEGSTLWGRRAVRSALRAARIDVRDLRIYDGSGLSVKNRLTPRMVASIIRWSLTSGTTAARALRRSLPVACRPGTLLRRMCETPAEGNLRGKTGLLSGVRGMAGWVRGADGVKTVYVAIFNRARSASALTSTLDLLGRRLARLR